MSSASGTLELGAERAPFVMLPTWLLRNRQASDGAKVLYGLLHDLVAGREGPTRAVTHGELAECGVVSVDTVDRRLSELIRAGAVEKQAQFETRQGQLANVYWVRLSPPAAALRPAVDNANAPGRTLAAPPVATVRPPEPQPCGNPGRDGAAPIRKNKIKKFPPNPLAVPGGPGDASQNGNGLLEASGPGGGRRAAGISLRASGANPRAAEALAATERERERAARLEAELEAKTAARLAAERAGEADRAAFEAEALAVSAALDDALLATIVDAIRDGMAGPLARSPLAVTRGVVDWCRAVTADGPDGTSLAAAAAAAIAAAGHPRVDAGEPRRFTVDGGASGMVPLRRRVAAVLVDTVAAT